MAWMSALLKRGIPVTTFGHVLKASTEVVSSSQMLFPDGWFVHQLRLSCGHCGMGFMLLKDFQELLPAPVVQVTSVAWNPIFP